MAINQCLPAALVTDVTVIQLSTGCLLWTSARIAYYPRAQTMIHMVSCLRVASRQSHIAVFA